VPQKRFGLPPPMAAVRPAQKRINHGLIDPIYFG
jgi:hypothetical protein